MYKPGDVIAEVGLRALQVCAGRGRNHFTTLTRDITINAKQFEWGFTIYLRRDFKPKTIIFKVYTGTKKTLYEHLSLKCPVCQKFCRWIYLDWDTLTGLCRACYKLPFTHEHTHSKPARWMKTDYLTFQKLFKKRIALLVAGITMKQIRAMKAPEFFQTHPYLVPPFFEMIATYDKALYQKSLHKLLGIYRKSIYLWKAPKLKQEEDDWLDRHLAERLSKEHGILKGESEWMKSNLPILKDSPNGTPQAPSTSPPSETDSSSSKTPSSPGTSVEPAEGKEPSGATSAEASAATLAMETPSSAPSVEEPGNSNAQSATAREVYLSFLNNHKDGPVPEGLFPPETK